MVNMIQLDQDKHLHCQLELDREYQILRSDIIEQLID